MINSVSLVGRNTRDIEIKQTQGGQAIASFSIAVDRGMSKAKKEEAEQQGKQTVDFINIVCFGNTAEYVSKYLKKGKLIAVEGKINTGSYTNKEGQKVYTTDILANNIQILEWDNDNSSNNNNTDDLVKGFHKVETTEDLPF